MGGVSYSLTAAAAVGVTSLVIIASMVVPLWALIVYGQGGHADEKACLTRATSTVFVGNDDFCGLGIRLGVYLQWTSQLFANAFTETEWKGNLVSYLVFSLALTVAVFLLTFQHQCAFTAEIIVILYIFWGGFLGVFYSSRAIDMNGEAYNNISPKAKGLAYGAFGPLCLMTLYSIWFWVRLATVDEVDFATTPGGSFFFLVDRFSVRTKAATRFLVFISFWFAWLTVGWAVSYL